MSQIVDQPRLDANWRAITAELDAPRPSSLERVLGRVGVPGHVSRVIVATPALRRAWYLALAVAVLVGLGATNPGDRGSLFTLLALAPTLPVLGVALAYGPAADPMYEAQLATPMRGLRLVAIRADHRAGGRRGRARRPDRAGARCPPDGLRVVATGPRSRRRALRS